MSLVTTAWVDFENHGLIEISHERKTWPRGSSLYMEARKNELKTEGTFFQPFQKSVWQFLR